MNKKYNFFLVSDSTGETLDRIFLAIKAQFKDIKYNLHHFSFIRTSVQTAQLMEKCKKKENPIIIYTLVEPSTSNFIKNESKLLNIPCFGVLDHLIPQFETLFQEKATKRPSGQHELNKEYYKKIEALQYTLAHDDGQQMSTIVNADIILLGVSRTSKTPTSIYLAEKGFKTGNIPLVEHQKVPSFVFNSNALLIGLYIDPDRLADIRKTRMNILNDKQEDHGYANIDFIKNEVNKSKKMFALQKIPTIDVTRKSVEETSAAIVKIYEIKKNL
jgi:regulator of PEP synthase PpsR (kinase-PPPase family)